MAILKRTMVRLIVLETKVYKEFVNARMIPFQSCSLNWGRWLKVSFFVPATPTICQFRSLYFSCLGSFGPFADFVTYKRVCWCWITIPAPVFQKVTVSAQFSEKLLHWGPVNSFGFFNAHIFFCEQKNKDSIKSWRFGKSFFLTSSFHDFFGFFFFIYLFVAGEHSKFLSIQDHSHYHLKAL